MGIQYETYKKISVKMTIEIKSFSSEEKENMSACYKIRDDIFVQEQSVDKSLEFDGLDDNAVHYLITVNGKNAGTTRWRELKEGIKIERFGILKKYRKKALGTLLLKFVIEELTSSKKQIFLHAQESSISFYENHHFICEGETFIEADIKHKKMIYKG